MKFSIPICFSPQQYKKIYLVMFIFIFIFPILTFGIGYYYGYTFVNFKSSSISPTVDGIINERDWKKSAVIIKQYTDVDNDFGNKDNFNYIYIGEDDKNIYLAFDLLTNTIVDPENNWIGIVFNMNSSENIRNESEWATSPTTDALFYNFKTNSSILTTDNRIWNKNGKNTILKFSVPFPNIKFGIPLSNDTYKYMRLHNSWYKMDDTKTEKNGFFIFADDVPYNQTIFNDRPNISKKIRYFEFNITIDFYSLFSYIPQEFLDLIFNNMEIKFNAGVLPLAYWGYKLPLDPFHPNPEIYDLYSNIGITCIARINNPKIYNLNSDLDSELQELVDNYILNEEKNGVTWTLFGLTDSLLYRSVEQDGFIQKTLNNNPKYNLIGPFMSFLLSLANIDFSKLSNISFELNWKETIKKNNGKLTFTIFGYHEFERLFITGPIGFARLDFGFAFDNFDLILNVSDSIFTSRYNYTTIKNYELKHSFGSSINSPIPHQMIEVKIPKSEFKKYNNNFSLTVFGYYGIKNFSRDFILGYDTAFILHNITYKFGILFSIYSTFTFFDSRNYYVVIIEHGKQRFEVE